MRRKHQKKIAIHVELSGRQSSEATRGRWWCMAAGVLFRQPKLDWDAGLLQRGEQIQRKNNWGLESQYFMTWSGSPSLKLCQLNRPAVLQLRAPVRTGLKSVVVEITTMQIICLPRLLSVQWCEVSKCSAGESERRRWRRRDLA